MCSLFVSLWSWFCVCVCSLFVCLWSWFCVCVCSLFVSLWSWFCVCVCSLFVCLWSWFCVCVCSLFVGLWSWFCVCVCSLFVSLCSWFCVCVCSLFVSPYSWFCVCLLIGLCVSVCWLFCNSSCFFLCVIVHFFLLLFVWGTDERQSEMHNFLQGNSMALSFLSFVTDVHMPLQLCWSFHSCHLSQMSTCHYSFAGLSTLVICHRCPHATTALLVFPLLSFVTDVHMPLQLCWSFHSSFVTDVHMPLQLCWSFHSCHLSQMSTCHYSFAGLSILVIFQCSCALSSPVFSVLIHLVDYGFDDWGSLVIKVADTILYAFMFSLCLVFVAVFSSMVQ